MTKSKLPPNSLLKPFHWKHRETVLRAIEMGIDVEGLDFDTIYYLLEYEERRLQQIEQELEEKPKSPSIDFDGCFNSIEQYRHIRVIYPLGYRWIFGISY